MTTRMVKAPYFRYSSIIQFGIRVINPFWLRGARSVCPPLDSQGIFHAPSRPVNSSANSAVVHFVKERRLPERHLPIWSFYHLYCSSVTSLHNLGCPSAIAGLVIACVVNSIKGMAGGWLAAHVGDEILKRFPSLANTNASSAVSSEPRIGRVHATTPHIDPCSVLRCPCHPVRNSIHLAILPIRYSYGN